MTADPAVTVLAALSDTIGCEVTRLGWRHREVCVTGPDALGSPVALCVSCDWPWQVRRSRRLLETLLLPRFRRLMADSTLLRRLP